MSNRSSPVNQAYRPCILLHCIYIYIYIYIYIGVLGPPESFKHRGLAYHYAASIYI